MGTGTAVASIRAPSYLAAHYRGALVVRWSRTSEPGELAPLARFVVDVAREERDPLDLVAIVAPLTSMPAPGLFDAIERFEAATRDCVRSAHLVFVGRSGFWRTIVRSMATRLIVVTGKHGAVTHHPTLDSALRRVCALRGIDVAELREALGVAGIGADAGA